MPASECSTRCVLGNPDGDGGQLPKRRACDSFAGVSLHHALMAGSESWAELSNAITSLVPQARKPEVIFNTHSSKPLLKANHHAMLAAPTHCDVSLISIFLFLQPVLNDLPLLQSGLS